MRKIFTGVLILISTAAMAVNVNPTNYLDRIDEIVAGQTLTFSNGIYVFTNVQLDKFATKLRDNVTIVASSGANVRFKSESNDMPVMTISNKKNVVFQNVKFFNISVKIEDCSGFRIKQVTMKDPRHSTIGDKKSNRRFLFISGGDDNQVIGCTLDWNTSDTGKYGSGIYISQGTDHLIKNCTIKGYLINGIGITAKKRTGDGTTGNTNHKVIGGSVTRQVYADDENDYLSEDHGIYILSVNNVQVNHVTVTGWSNNNSGYQIKLKGVVNVDITNCTLGANNNQGGITINEESGYLENRNIDIINNNFVSEGIKGFGISSRQACYGRVTIRDNKFSSIGKIDMPREVPSDFNSNGGGIHNNCGISSSDILMPSGINRTFGCGFDASAARQIDESIDLVSDFQEFGIFPNPSSGSVINLMIGQDLSMVKLEILDIHGKVVYSVSNISTEEGHIKLKLDNPLNSGIYIIDLTNGDYREQARLLVQ